jgi:beta-mannosidase
MTEADYRALLDMARKANMNMLRVWGGGLREKRAFYELCDRLGIMVWQEFPFACSFLTRFPRSWEYMDLVETEAAAIVRDLRRHPSVVCWCGGNEFSPERNRLLVATLRRTVTAGDPTRPFLEASPTGGDGHNWKVWHGFCAPLTYKDDNTMFASEFGMQAPPDATTLRRFVPEGELWPPGLAWTYHGAGLRKLRRYAKPYLSPGQPQTLDAFVNASQRAQAQGLQIAVEHYRRRKAAGCGGVLIWQLNEPWPAISWALIDFYRNPKPSYEVVKRLFSPVLVSVEYALREYQPGDGLSGTLWLINDASEAVGDCEVEVLLWDGQSRPVERFARIVDLAGHSASPSGSFCWNLPPGGGWRLTCRLVQDGQLLSDNEYDLTTHDGLGPTPWQRMWSWLAGLVTPA